MRKVIFLSEPVIWYKLTWKAVLWCDRNMVWQDPQPVHWSWMFLKQKGLSHAKKKTTRYFQSRPTRIWNNNLQEGGSQKRNCRAIGTCWFSKVGLNRSPYSCVGEEEIISPRPLLLLPGLLRVHGKLPSHLSPLKSGFGSAPDCRRPLLFLSPPALPFQAHPTSLTPTLVLFALPNLPAKPVPLLSGKESSPHPGECQLQPVTSILHYRDTL